MGDRIKLLSLGDPGTGKTGGLASLLGAGYRVCMYDFDGLLQSLRGACRHFKIDQSKLFAQTLTDKFKGNAQPLMLVGKVLHVTSPTDGIPKAYPKALQQFEHWKTETEDLGVPASWGSDTILVIDSLTWMAQSALRYTQAMNTGAQDPRTWYGAAQNLIRNALLTLCSDAFSCHLIVNAHIDYDKNQFELMRGFPKSVGVAMQTEIGSLFNSILLFKIQGTKRIISTVPDGVVDVKNPAFELQGTLPLETGLADFFKAATSN